MRKLGLFAATSLCALTLLAGPAGAGQPNQSCETTGSRPGHASSAPGSAFNEDGVAGTKYAGEQDHHDAKAGHADEQPEREVALHESEEPLLLVQALVDVRPDRPRVDPVGQEPGGETLRKGVAVDAGRHCDEGAARRGVASEER